MTAVSPLGNVVDRLAARGHEPRSAGDSYEARCPAHDDSRASLSIGEGDDGRVLVHCHAGCETEAVLRAVDLDLKDLFPRARTNGNDGPGRRIAETYDYTDESGRLLYQALRYDPKGFAQRRPDGSGGWVWKLGDTRRVLYRLPTVLEAANRDETIYVVEGEKDVHALERAGVVATCNAMGAGKWRIEYSQALAGADVIVVADRDDAGRKHAAAVAASLREHLASVRVVEAATGKDAADHLGAGRTLDDFVPVEEPAVAPVAHVAPTSGGGRARRAGPPAR